MNLQGSGVGALPPSGYSPAPVSYFEALSANVYHKFANLIKKAKKARSKGRKGEFWLHAISFVKESRSSLLCKI